MIVFKSYDQGADAFQSEKCHGIWNDEEPPYDIYKEQLMRLIDYNGEMITSMTSLHGITELLEKVFDGYNTIKSQNAPLINKILPRIAERNNKKFYFLWTTDNKHIDQERLANDIKLMTEQEITTRVYGMPINLTGRIYPMLSPPVS